MRKANFRQSEILSEDDLFKSIVGSAFEFLEKAILEFEQSAKFSTVHFAIAIELFLKARLMREHWSLLLDKPDSGEKAEFFKGNGKTVTPDQAIERLRKIADVTIPAHTRDIFSSIAKHRNKMVHFVHTDDRLDDQNSTAQIVAEQCAGWLSLRLLLESWEEFASFEGEIWRIGRAMERHRAYLEAKFESQKEHLKKHMTAGGRVSVCPSCNFESVCIDDPQGAISPSSCMVCWYDGAEIRIDCLGPDCHGQISFNNYEGAPDYCPHCRTSIGSSFLEEALNTGGRGYDEITRVINCTQCSECNTGVEHHDLFVCVECFDTSHEMGICGYCSEGQMGGVPENSYLVGCERCEGALGNMRDD